MSDNISRQAAIDEIVGWTVYETSEEVLKAVEKTNVASVIDGIACAIRAVKNLPSVDEWIPCSERLPEKYGWYQVTTSDEEVACRWYSDLHGWETFDDAVIAWLPRPEPYRKEKQ